MASRSPLQIKMLVAAAGAVEGWVSLATCYERRTANLLESDELGAVLFPGPDGKARFVINDPGRAVARGAEQRRAQREQREPVRLRLVPDGAARARLVIQRGDETLDVLGERVGCAWTWHDPRSPTYLRLLPRLAAELQEGATCWGAALASSGLVGSSSLLSAERGTRQRAGAPPP